MGHASWVPIVSARRRCGAPTLQALLRLSCVSLWMALPPRTALWCASQRYSSPDWNSLARWLAVTHAPLFVTQQHAQMSPVDPTHVGIAFYNTPAGPRVAWSEPVAGDNATLSAIRCAFVNGTDRKTLLEGVEVGARGELTVQL